MKAKQWKAGLLAAAMLASMVLPAAAVEEPETPEQPDRTVVQTDPNVSEPVETEVVTEDVGAPTFEPGTGLEPAVGTEPEEDPPELGSVYGPNGESLAIELTLTCTNEMAAHKGGNSKTSSKNFLSASNWDLERAEFSQEGDVWYGTLYLDGEKLLNEQFTDAVHTVTSNPAVTVAYQDGKWCIQSEESPAQLTVEGVCTAEGPAAPELGENLEVWVQMYSGEYDPVSGSQIDRHPEKYGDSVSFGDPYYEDGAWLCDMTVVGYSFDPELAESCFVNQELEGYYDDYQIDPYEVLFGQDADKTVTLTYNQKTAKWEAPALSLKQTSNGPGESNPKIKYGVAFKVEDKVEGTTTAPSLPVENPVHNGGFWVSLYVVNDAGEPEKEVYTQVYDGTQDYVSFSEPEAGAGILQTYAAVATVKGEDVLAASGLEGYQLSKAGEVKENELIFDWDTMTWTAQTMSPSDFDQPGTTIAKRGVAFRVESTEPAPVAPPAPDGDKNCRDFQVTVYGAVPQLDGTVVNKNLLGYRWDLADEASIKIGEMKQNEEGVWTCDVTVDATEMVQSVCEEHQSGHYRLTDDPMVKTVTLTYDETKEKWIAPSDGITYGYPSYPEYKNGVAFGLLQQFTIIFNPGLNAEGEEFESEAYDAGATVKLPETVDFTREGYVFAGWKTTIKQGTNYTTYLYPIGTNMTMFAKEKLEVEAYWMNVELTVAAEPYDPDKAVKDYTFSDTATVEGGDGEVTLLYKATVKGNSQYPYTLVCDGAQAVYDTALEGAIPKYNTQTVVYFTKTYTVDEAETIEETVKMGNASDSASVTIDLSKVLTLTAGGEDTVYTGSQTVYTLTAVGEKGDTGTMRFSFLLDGQYVADSVKLEALNGFMMVQSAPEETENGMLYEVMLTQMSGLNTLSSSKRTDVLSITLTAGDQPGEITLTPVELSFSFETTGPDVEGQVGAPVVSQVWVQYDVNGDGVLAMSDVNAMKVYYQAREGDENWDTAKRADLNEDGVVDVEDLSMLMEILLKME